MIKQNWSRRRHILDQKLGKRVNTYGTFAVCSGLCQTQEQSDADTVLSSNGSQMGAAFETEMWARKMN